MVRGSWFAGKDFLEALLDLADGGDAVVEEEDLSAAREFRLDRRLDDEVRVGDDLSVDGHAFARRRAE